MEPVPVYSLHPLLLCLFSSKYIPLKWLYMYPIPSVGSVNILGSLGKEDDTHVDVCAKMGRPSGCDYISMLWGRDTENTPGSRYSSITPAQSPSSNDPLKQDLALGVAFQRWPPIVAFSDNQAHVGSGASINDMSTYYGRNYDWPDLVAVWVSHNWGQKVILEFRTGHCHLPTELLLAPAVLTLCQ